MNCSQFVLELEEDLAAHPGLPEAIASRLAAHANGCEGCRQHWQTAVETRSLLSGLRRLDAGVPDPGFAANVGNRILARKARSAWERWRGLTIARRDLVVATVLFVITLGSFVYNFTHIERPNMDEAFALDVPHLNPQHPSDDHLRPRNADAMLNLMTP